MTNLHTGCSAPDTEQIHPRSQDISIHALNLFTLYQSAGIIVWIPVERLIVESFVGRFGQKPLINTALARLIANRQN